MKKRVGEMWSEQEGSRKVWLVQFPHGRVRYYVKRTAQMWADQLKKDIERGIVNA